MNATATFLQSSTALLQFYKNLGEKAMEQVPDEGLFWKYNEDSNSIATIVKHLSGNMFSRWTDFLNSDGEKEWRERDGEFENDLKSRKEIMEKWEAGWQLLFDTIGSLSEKDVEKTVYIRAEPHSVMDAINRQLAHYACHVGQIIYLGKMLLDGNWQSLSIPKGQSKLFLRENLKKGPSKGLNFRTSSIEKKKFPNLSQLKCQKNPIPWSCNMRKWPIGICLSGYSGTKRSHHWPIGLPKAPKGPLIT